jgi:hypothetical protein
MVHTVRSMVQSQLITKKVETLKTHSLDQPSTVYLSLMPPPKLAEHIFSRTSSCVTEQSVDSLYNEVLIVLHSPHITKLKVTLSS